MNSNDRDRKKEWILGQKLAARAALPMPEPLLESLFESVDASVQDAGCDHTLHFTKQWIAEHGQVESSVLTWLKSHGGFCDCEVLANAAGHWDQNR